MDELEQEIERLKGDRNGKEDRANLRERTARLHDAHAGGAGRPAQARRDRRKRFAEYEQAKRDLSGGNLRLVVASPRSIAIAA